MSTHLLAAAAAYLPVPLELDPVPAQLALQSLRLQQGLALWIAQPGQSVLNPLHQAPVMHVAYRAPADAWTDQ